MASIKDISDSELYKMKTNLEKIQENRIRAEEQLKMALQDLEEQGFESIESGKEGLVEKHKRIDRLVKKADGEYQEFMEGYGELF